MVTLSPMRLAVRAAVSPSAPQPRIRIPAARGWRRMHGERPHRQSPRRATSHCRHGHSCEQQSCHQLVPRPVADQLREKALSHRDMGDTVQVGANGMIVPGASQEGNVGVRSGLCRFATQHPAIPRSGPAKALEGCTKVRRSMDDCPSSRSPFGVATVYRAGSAEAYNWLMWRLFSS